MAQKKKSQKLMLDHSKAKVLLLQKYLEKYLNIIANDGYTKKINVFDLFCGEGIYENDGEGSPIAILRTLKDLHFINKAKNKDLVKVDLYFNDKDEFKIEKLESIISDKKLHYEAFGKITYRSKDYKEIIDSLSTYIQNLNNEKAFVFIDPYGYKEIRASEIKKLLQSKKSEVLLFLPTQFMYRFNEKGTPEVPIEFIQKVFFVMNDTPQHTYQVLTKRADRLFELHDQLTWTDNIWMGVSVEDERVTQRINFLRQINAQTKFLSCEPLIGPLRQMNLTGIDWVIVGGESGKKARPMYESWVWDIKQQCAEQGAAFFFKQWGGVNKKKAGRELGGRTYDEMPVLHIQ